MYGSAGASGYVIPRYRAAGSAAWYHVLHGNIPGHQIDFMYCPEVPQGPLTTTHFSHLARLMKYIEPQTGATHAFAIGNLSRDDTQHEPGHGAVGLIFGFRIGGAVDHAGRGNPPFAHGLVAVDRELGYTSLLEASATFYRHVMNATEANSSASMFYREYVHAVREAPERVPHVLERYVEEFADLPYLRQSSATWDWVAEEGAQPKRVVIVHKHDEPFGAIAHAAVKIATVLYRSNIKWTSITSGREADIPGGVSVRFVRERDVTLEDRHGVLLRIEEVAEDEAEIARGMFGARPNEVEPERPRYAGGWRERYAAQQAGGAALVDKAAGARLPVAAAGELGRRPASAPPSHGGLTWSEAGAGVAAQGAGLAAGAGVVAQGAGVAAQGAGPGGPMSAAGPMSMGPKGTLVIDAERVLKGDAERVLNNAQPVVPQPGGSQPGVPAVGGAGLGGAALGSGATLRSPVELARGGAAAAMAQTSLGAGVGAAAPQRVLPPVAANGGAMGEELGDIPIIVEPPRKSRAAVWAVAGVGCAIAAGAIAWVVTSRGGTEQPAPPAVEPSAPAPAEGAASGTRAPEAADTEKPPAAASATAASTAQQAEAAGDAASASAGAEGGEEEKTQASTTDQRKKTGSGKTGAKSPAPQKRKTEPKRDPEPAKPVGAIQPTVKF